MSKKFSQFNPFSALTGAEQIPGIQNGDNAIGALNDVFKTYFDSLYWPSTGAFDLTGALTIDGNDFDLIYGSPNRLDGFQVLANGGIVLNDDDGVDDANFGFSGSGGFSFSGTQDFGVDVDGDISYSAHQFLTTAENSIEYLVDDGVDSSSFSLSPTQLNVDVIDDVRLTATDGSNFVDLLLSSGVNGFFLEHSDGVNPSAFFIVNSTQIIARSPRFVQGSTTDANRQRRQFIWYDASIVNGTGSPADTTSDLALMAESDNIAKITIHVTAIESDGSEQYTAEKIYTFRKDGSANPVSVSDLSAFESADDGTANAVLLVSGSNIRLTMTTPASKTYRWFVFGDMIKTQV